MNAAVEERSVVVVGAGVLGVASALALARRGVGVRLLTAGQPADGASGRSLAWLNSAAERSAAYHALRMAGLQRYRRLAADCGGSAVHLDGALNWAAPGESYRARHDHEQRIGYPSRWVDARFVADRVPGVDPAMLPAEGAILNPSDGWVDLPMLITTLLARFADLGGEVITEAGECRVELSGGRTVGVITGTGRRIGADAVLLAAGAATPGMAADLGFALPDQTSIAALARVRPVDGPTDLQVVLNTPAVSVRPTVDGGLVMDSGWSEREVVRLADGSHRVERSTLDRLLDEARAVLAGHPRLQLLGVGHGPKPIPGDGEPVLGPLPGVDGCWVAFSHSGATLGLIVGELLAAEIAGADPDPLLADFRPSRFEA
ncbi:NAD(P)/FAD-dependent oxidoreductase [Microlunatus soli]|uniref:NAD(P)/FAD-dependent oxidoreductase n=1 Tax=Microlunatus soli TaxID=630515 RepID=UPI00155F9A7B|nr:FAD-binding oxidoreductase [Microlunatus soli]